MSCRRSEETPRRVGRPEMISGIHDYCDRWCERCEFTGRCSVHAILAQDERGSSMPIGTVGEESSAGRDASPAADATAMFAALTGRALKEAAESRGEEAEQRGIDQDAFIGDQVERAIRIKEKAEQHPVLIAAREYSFAVHAWFHRLEGPLRARLPVSQAQRNASELRRRGEEAVRTIGDAMETILRYHLLITTKLFRAVSQESTRCHDEACSGDDADGSAKVALIAIDGSLASWHRLVEYVPDSRRVIRGFVAKLEQLLRDVEQQWPEARSFVRPGFDDTTN